MPLYDARQCTMSYDLSIPSPMSWPWAVQSLPVFPWAHEASFGWPRAFCFHIRSPKSEEHMGFVFHLLLQSIYRDTHTKCDQL